ncbi:flagellar assembly protein T N-terminal domain-containing protein [Oceanisphaera psychrotolerans]|uniref:flagellar assembly protein T N-terminal domain-containing protein n=1 Tax=Oceanisphaera psychrotolerans TaxID=1414654 RepID=UPI001FDF8FC7|nr:flagellar assembly protein T N-terminal domain-containing protein [Oceanisphaera psychrotolerans]
MSIKALLPSLFLLLPLAAQADWYQAEGSAPLGLGAETARQQALEQALTDALLQAGASLTTVQSVTDGTLSGQRLDIAAQGELMDYVILDERRSQGRLWLTLRADIWPNERVQPQCTGRYRPGLTLSAFPLLRPEQGSIGQIFELGTAVTARLAQHLATSVNLMTQLPHQLTTDSRLPRSPGLRQGSDVLAQQQQSRLLLSGVIDDISMAEGNWMEWRFSELPRQFGLSVTLEDSLTGERLLQQHYQATSPWSFDKHAKVRVHEQGFWQSAYGQSADQLLKRVARDVINAQSCMKAIGHILQQSEEGILMDLGRQAGIQPGDRFTLIHRRQLQPGYYSETSSQAQFVVQQSHTDYSLLTPADAVARQIRISPGDMLTSVK